MLLLLWAEKEQLKKVVELKKKQLKNDYGKIKVKKNKTEKEVVTKLKFFPPFVLFFFITMIDNTISAAQHRTWKDVLKKQKLEAAQAVLKCTACCVA